MDPNANETFDITLSHQLARDFACAEREMKRTDWGAAAHQWQRLAGLLSAESHLVYACESLIHCLRKQNDMKGVGQVLNSINTSALKRSLAAHRWAYDCEAAVSAMLGCTVRRPPIQRNVVEASQDFRLEVFGPPGVGKTSVVAKMRTLRDKEKPEFLTMREIAGSLADEHFAGSRVRFQTFLDLLCSQENSRFWNKHQVEVLRRLALTELCRSSGAGRVIVEDEGLAQRGINLAHQRPQPPEQFIRYYMTMPKPDALFVFLAEPHHICERNRIRAASTTRGDLGAARFFNLWVVDIVRRVLAARGVPTVVIDNSNDVDDGSRKVFIEVGKLLP